MADPPSTQPVSQSGLSQTNQSPWYSTPLTHQTPSSNPLNGIEAHEHMKEKGKGESKENERQAERTPLTDQMLSSGLTNDIGDGRTPPTAYEESAPPAVPSFSLFPDLTAGDSAESDGPRLAPPPDTELSSVTLISEADAADANRTIKKVWPYRIHDLPAWYAENNLFPSKGSPATTASSRRSTMPQTPTYTGEDAGEVRRVQGMAKFNPSDMTLTPEMVKSLAGVTLSIDIVSRILRHIRGPPPDDRTKEQRERQRRAEAKRYELAFVDEVRKVWPNLLDEQMQNNRRILALTVSRHDLPSRLTPDILFDKAVDIMGISCSWIEYKSNFGHREIGDVYKNTRAQLWKYVNELGAGLIAWRLGFEREFMDMDDVIHCREEDVRKYLQEMLEPEEAELADAEMEEVEPEKIDREKADAMEDVRP